MGEREKNINKRKITDWCTIRPDTNYDRKICRNVPKHANESSNIRTGSFDCIFSVPCFKNVIDIFTNETAISLYKEMYAYVIVSIGIWEIDRRSDCNYGLKLLPKALNVI